MTDKEAKVLLIMIYAKSNKSYELEGKGLNKFMESTLAKISSKMKENLKEYLLESKINSPITQ